MQIVNNLKLNKITKNIFLVLIGTALLTLSAKVKIPFYPVPMTMQTFMIMLIGFAYGWRLGLITVSLYLIQGSIGLPVFAGTPEKGMGLSYFVGPTMGYLIGFLPAVFIAGCLSKNKRTFFNDFFVFFFSASMIYIFGIIWLSKFVGWDKIFLLGVQPFILAELFKILLLCIIVRYINK